MTMPASGFFVDGDQATAMPLAIGSSVHPHPSLPQQAQQQHLQQNGAHHIPDNQNHTALQMALELTLMQLKNATGNQDHAGPNTDLEAFMAAEEKKKASSQNMTECVPVPSSEHVAEIVGRQGCKIKALRAKTNTYIKTPVRGEEPVFVVTGRSEDVSSAKVEIMSAADHFSQIRACRKNNTNGSMAPGPPNVPGQVTYEVKVPYRVVGLVVGPKGATIKRIQQQTQTYIVTPSREKDPIFEVTGLPENVCLAKKEIEAHIAMRTGNENTYPPMYDDQVAAAALAIVNGRTDNQPLDNYMNGNDFLHNMCKYSNDGSTSSLNGVLTNSNGLNGSHFVNNLSGMNSSLGNGLNSLNGMGSIGSDHSEFRTNGISAINNYGNDLGTFSNSDNALYPNGARGPAEMPMPPIGSGLAPKYNGLCMPQSLFNSEDGLDRHSADSSYTAGTSMWSDAGKSLGAPLCAPMGGSHVRPFSTAVGSGSFNRPSYASVGNSATVSPDFELHSHHPASRSSSDPNCGRNPLPGFGQLTLDSRSPSTQSPGSSPELAALAEERINAPAAQAQICIVCLKSSVVAALIPCGHNLFCLDCASNMVVEKKKCKSPVCDQVPTDYIRILRSNRA